MAPKRKPVNQKSIPITTCAPVQLVTRADKQGISRAAALQRGLKELLAEQEAEGESRQA